jgi:hypothetical protein
MRRTVPRIQMHLDARLLCVCPGHFHEIPWGPPWGKCMDPHGAALKATYVPCFRRA